MAMSDALPPETALVAEWVRRGYTLGEAARMAGVTANLVSLWNRKAEWGLVPYATEWEAMIGKAWLRGEKLRKARLVARQRTEPSWLGQGTGGTMMASIVWRATLRDCLERESTDPDVGDEWR